MPKVTHGTDTSEKTTIEYDYDRAFRIIELVQRAVDDQGFYAGVLAGYELAGALSAHFTAAVDEQRQFAADEAECGTDIDTHDRTIQN
jgi:hypothetical protein